MHTTWCIDWANLCIATYIYDAFVPYSHRQMCSTSQSRPLTNVTSTYSCAHTHAHTQAHTWHVLNATSLERLLSAHAVFVGESSLDDVCADLHVAVGVLAKPSIGLSACMWEANTANKIDGGDDGDTPFIIDHWSFTFHHLLYTMYYKLCAKHHVPHTMFHTLYITHRNTRNTCTRSSFITRSTPKFWRL